MVGGEQQVEKKEMVLREGEQEEGKRRVLGGGQQGEGKEREVVMAVGKKRRERGDC